MKRSAPNDVSENEEIAKRLNADGSSPSSLNTLSASAESIEKPLESLPHKAATEEASASAPLTSSKEATSENVDISKYKIFVGGLDPRVTTLELTQYFETFGRTVDCVVMQDRATGRPRGFG